MRETIQSTNKDSKIIKLFYCKSYLVIMKKKYKSAYETNIRKRTLKMTVEKPFTIFSYLS